MDAVNRWLDAQTQTPAGSLILFFVGCIVRVVIADLLERRKRRQTKPRQSAARKPDTKPGQT